MPAKRRSSSSSARRLLDAGELLVDLADQVGVLGAHLGELDVALERAEELELALRARVLGVDLRRPLLVAPEVRVLHLLLELCDLLLERGRVEVLAQARELLANGAQALGQRLGCGGTGHAFSLQSARPVNPLLLPPKLVLRALDDLHALASHACRASTERARRAILAMGQAIVERADRMDERAGELVDRLDKQADALLEQSKALHEQAAAILVQGERVEEAGREVADRGAQLAEALPVLQRAVEMAQPLEGAVERLGRMVDRLPGAKRV